ncbi:MAG: glycosyltransferase [Candidatus Glassbacteria bacterium]|nr:glycosyltransferase [Candidatus Glassbacteria bacterium]
MKIAWLGNLCNVGFNNVRLLNSAGVDAELYLPAVRLKRPGVSNPEHEYEGASREHFLRPYNRDYLNYLLNRIGVPGPLSTHEHAVGRSVSLVQAQTCSEISALRIRRRYGVPYAALATGADLSEIAPGRSPLSRLYRSALKGSSHLFLTNIDQFATLDALGLNLPSVSFLPFSIGMDRFEPRPNRPGAETVFFSVARLDWTSTSRKSTKSNDIFLKGFARFVREREIGNYKLWIADWGVDRQATRELVDSLGIGRLVSYLEPGNKQAFYASLARAHVVVDQFKLGAVGLAALESMAMSRPVFACCNQGLAQKAYGEDIPVINCANEEEVSAALATITPAAVEEMARTVYDWVGRHHSESGIAKLLIDTYRKILAAGEKANR